MRLIRKLRTHSNPHADELAAIRTFRRYCEKNGVNAKDAVIEVWDSETIADEPDVVYFGIGGDEFEKARKNRTPLQCIVFDEHRSKMANGRMADECCATLVARYLDLRGHFDNLFFDVMYCDSNPGIRETRLSTIVKTMHAHKKLADVEAWFNQAFDALLDFKKYGPCDLLAEFAAYKQDHPELLPELAARIDSLIRMSTNAHRNPTELMVVLEYMPVDQRRDWLHQIFDVLCADKVLFDEAISIVGTSPVVEIHTEGGVKRVIALNASRENPHLHRVAKTKHKATIAIIRRPSGGYAIMADQKDQSLNLTPTMAMLRMAEVFLRQGVRRRMLELAGDGTHQLCPVWHKPTSHMILNGSVTHPNVEPSRLTLEQVTEIVAASLTRSTMQNWSLRFESGKWPHSFGGDMNTLGQVYDNAVRKAA